MPERAETNAEATLEEMAQAHERGRQELEEAQAALAEIEPQYKAARARVSQIKTAIDVIEDGMENARRAYMIDLAVKDAGLAELVGAAPRTLAVAGFNSLNRWELTAVGPEGTPLYVQKSGKRSRATKSFARPPRPEDADLLAAYNAIGAEEKVAWEAYKDSNYDRELQAALNEARAEAKRKRRELVGPSEHEAVPEAIRGLEGQLVQWQERGTGDFGAGSGSMKPQPPPEGGRWKWLKVREQAELEGAE